ncbi:MAG TPA: DciA family protein [Streptosporangiaceae bacterium]|nr:DciA family protein [Streptosporangiaceae bacterium]
MPDDADRARVAREALERAKADARARGNRPARPQDQNPERPGSPGPAPSRLGGRRARRDDPELLTAAIDGLIDSRGWRESAAAGSVFARWAEIVGPELAAHTRPDSLSGRELTVTADSTAWATQVRLLAAQLVRRLNAELGDGSVDRVKVRGPSGPPRRPGEWRVRGGRGPRDTYG